MSSNMNVQFTSGRPQPGINPDTYAQNYANQKGITLEEAKAELKAKYGDPQKPSKSGNVDPMSMNGSLFNESNNISIKSKLIKF